MLPSWGCFLPFFSNKSIFLFLGLVKGLYISNLFYLQDSSWGWTSSSPPTSPSPPQGESQKSNGADGQRQKPPRPPQHHLSKFFPLSFLQHSLNPTSTSLSFLLSFSSSHQHHNLDWFFHNLKTFSFFTPSFLINRSSQASFTTSVF